MFLLIKTAHQSSIRSKSICSICSSEILNTNQSPSISFNNYVPPTANQSGTRGCVHI